MSTAVRSGAARQVLLASRPLSWVNTAYPFGAAYLLSNGGMDLTGVVGILFFLVPYNLAMYGINDVFDYESDRRNPRKGGAQGALLDRPLHRPTLLIAATLPVPFVVYLLAVGSLPAALVLLGSLFFVVAYSVPGLRFKERPGLDSVTSSLHFTTPALYGVVLAGEPLGAMVWTVLAAFFLWGMASHAFGAVQDVPADRTGGIASIATELGAARTVRLALLLYAAAGLVLLTLGWPGGLAALLVLPYVWLVWPFRSVSDADAPAATRGWRRFLGANYLCGFLLTQLLIWMALR